MSHFNEVANEWDSEGKVKLMQALASNTKKVLNLKGQFDIMDFGAGTGLFGLEFKDNIKSLLGVDVSEGMLKVFDEKTANYENIQSKNIDLEKETLDDKFDLIVSSMAFHHLVNPKDVLKKLKKNLNTNGKIAIVDLDKEDGTFHPDNEGMGVKHFGFSKEELESWAKEAGLGLEHTIINTIEKNDKTYQQFLAVFK